MKTILSLLVIFLGCSTFANVVQLAPEFSWRGPGRQATTLKSLRGQPVVLLVARSATEGKFKSQVKKLKELYPQFASQKVVFVAAFETGDGQIDSDIPFVIAENGPRVASAYRVDGPFNLIIIGKDGNMDLQTPKVCPAQRVKDVISNSFVVQSDARK